MTSSAHNAASILQKAAEQYPDRAAISVDTEVRYTYREFAQRVAATAGALRGKLEPGSRIGLYMHNNPDYYTVLFGAWHAGMVAVPINTMLPAPKACDLLVDAEAAWCFITSGLAESFAPHASGLKSLKGWTTADAGEFQEQFIQAEPIDLTAVDPEDIAWMFYTSGTTGRPKGAQLRHGGLLKMIGEYLEEVDQLQPEHCILHLTPMSHGTGMVGLPHVAVGANHVIPSFTDFDPVKAFQIIPHWPHATLCLAPIMIKMVTQNKTAEWDPLATIRTVIYGGSPMYGADLAQAVRAFGPKFVQLYGLGENPLSISVLDKDTHQRALTEDNPSILESVGVVRRNTELRILDALGHDLGPNQIGQIVCKGDVVMAGYWNNPAANRRALQGGWFHTGDMGYLDDAGFLHLKDRMKDVIYSANGPIYPRDVEAVLVQHPGVATAAVVGMSQRGRERAVAYVVLEQGAALDENALSKLCRENLDKTQVPSRYVQIAELPRNNYGKVLKGELRRPLDLESSRELLSYWRVYDLVSWDGITFRAAETLDDARHVRRLIRKAWKIVEPEPYFYTAFDDAQNIYDTYIYPSLDNGDITQLEGLPVLVEAPDGTPVGTVTFAFDHDMKLVEWGRGGADPDFKGGNFTSLLMEYAHRLLPYFKDYSLVSDTTCLSRALADKLTDGGLMPVAFHPSSFVVQSSCVALWREDIAAKTSPQIASAMLYESPDTGLGRFSTTFHLQPSENLVLNRPYLTKEQEPFFEHTKNALGITDADLQDVDIDVNSGMYQLVAAGTRTLVAPDDSFDPETYLAEALKEGIETVILRVPLTKAGLEISRKLRRHACLSGVFPNGNGAWLASYTLTTLSAEKVLSDLKIMKKIGAFKSTLPLINLVQTHIETYQL